MERYTNEQRILIVKLFYKNGESFAATVRELRSIWGHNNAPKESTVKRLMDKFVETGSVSDVKTTTRHRPGRSTENVAAVRDDIAQTPSTSIRHRAQQLGVSKSTMQRILTKDLHLHADHGQRKEFVNWVLERQHENENALDCSLLQDEDEHQSAKSNTEISSPTVYYEDISAMDIPACGTLDTMVHMPPHCSTAADSPYDIEIIDHIKNECEDQQSVESETECAPLPMPGSIKANNKEASTTSYSYRTVGDEEGTKIRPPLHEMPNGTSKNAQQINGLKYAKFETFIASAMEVMQDPEMEKLTELKVRMIVSEMSYKAAKRQLAIFNEAKND